MPQSRMLEKRTTPPLFPLPWKESPPLAHNKTTGDLRDAGKERKVSPVEEELGSRGGEAGDPVEDGAVRQRDEEDVRKLRQKVADGVRAHPVHVGGLRK